MANKTINQLSQIDSLAGGDEFPIYDESTGTTKKTTVNQINDFVADGAITDAINALDVSEVGGNGKYIKAISETDGKISATVETMDSTPTEGSSKAVTSGGVKTALNGKQNTLTAGANIKIENDVIEGTSDLPTDAVLHYSFDEIPDMPDGTADVRLTDGNTYDLQSTSYYAGNSGGTTFSNLNGNVQAVISSGQSWNGLVIQYTTSKIIKIKIKVSSLVGSLQVLNGLITDYIRMGTITSNGEYTYTALFNQDASTKGFGVLVSNASSSATVEILGIYIGDGSYTTPIIDNSGNGNNATNNGVVAVQGVCGKGVYCFQTSRKYIDLGNKSLTPNFSISMWINSKSNAASTLGILLYKQNQILLRNGMQWSQHLALYLYGENGTLLSAQNIGDLLPLNEWCHLVITREGTTLKVYRNGVLTHTVTLADGTLATNNNNMTLLGYNSSDTMRECLADDLLIFDRALSEEEVTALYLNKANTPKFYNLNDYKLKGIPTPPTTDGNYVLVANISSGVLTYSWVAQS